VQSSENKIFDCVQIYIFVSSLLAAIVHEVRYIGKFIHSSKNFSLFLRWSRAMNLKEKSADNFYIGVMRIIYIQIH